MYCLDADAIDTAWKNYWDNFYASAWDVYRNAGPLLKIPPFMQFLATQARQRADRTLHLRPPHAHLAVGARHPLRRIPPERAGAPRHLQARPRRGGVS